MEEGADLADRGRGCDSWGAPAVERVKLSFYKEGWKGNELGGVEGEKLDLEIDRRFGSDGLVFVSSHNNRLVNRNN